MAKIFNNSESDDYTNENILYNEKNVALSVGKIKLEIKIVENLFIKEEPVDNESLVSIYKN